MNGRSCEAGSNRDVTILIVDDDPDLLLLCATHLRSAGYAVLMALGSAEAQATCEVYPTKIDLIDLDALLYPRAVDIDHDDNMMPRVHGGQTDFAPADQTAAQSDSPNVGLEAMDVTRTRHARDTARLPILAKAVHQASLARQGAGGAQ